MKLNNKLIIHNYTNLNDLKVLSYIMNVVKNGKISKCKGKEQYSFITTFGNIFTGKKYIISCDMRDTGYTFKIVEEKDDNKGIKNNK